MSYDNNNNMKKIENWKNWNWGVCTSENGKMEKCKKIKIKLGNMYIG